MERVFLVVVSLVLGYAAIAGVIWLGFEIVQRYRTEPHPCGDPDCTEDHDERV